MLCSILEAHRMMLADSIRTDSYRKAIFESVKKGDIVADIGTGTGILAFFACQAGAERVFAIEETNMIEIAKQIAKENNMADKIIFIKGHSNMVTLPEKVDLVISEILGAFALEENILNVLYDARKRFLKPKGIIIPSAIDLYIVPIESFNLYRKIDFWKIGLYGLNFSAMTEIAKNVYYQQRIKPKCLLSDPLVINHFDLKRIKRDIIDSAVTFLTKRSGVLHGLAGWFSVRLSKNVTLTNSPLSLGTHWCNIFFPIGEPTEVKRGDLIKFTVRGNPAGININWSIEITKRYGYRFAQTIRFNHSGFKGLLLSKSALKTLMGYSMKYRPQVSETGKVELFILNLCNKGKTIQEITRALKKRYPLRYKTTTKTIEKVAGIIGKYEKMLD